MYAATKKSLVSICVPCYNHKKYIPYFMESILKQDYEHHVRLLFHFKSALSPEPTCTKSEL